MNQQRYPDSEPCFREGSRIFLALCWTLGLILGIVYSIAAGEPLTALMGSALFGRASIFSLLASLCLPFLLAVLAVYLRSPVLLSVIGFFKAFSFSLISMGCLSAFGSGGWLARIGLMFSDILALPAVFWFLLCLSRGKEALSRVPLFCAAAAVFVAAAVDYLYISPIFQEWMII